jgi:hypothetical protein
MRTPQKRNGNKYVVYFSNYNLYFIGIFLYVILFTKIKRDSAFFHSLTEVGVLKQEISNNFTGFIICLDAVRNGDNRLITNKLQRILEDRKLISRVIDVPASFGQDPSLSRIIQINIVPCVVYINKGIQISLTSHLLGLTSLERWKA